MAEHEHSKIFNEFTPEYGSRSDNSLKFYLIIITLDVSRVWHMLVSMGKLNTSDNNLGELVSSWLTFPEVAELLDVKIAAVHRLACEGKLIFVTLGEQKVKSVPADFFVDGRLLDSLPGTLTVLCDVGLSSAEIIEWFFSEDPSLPGMPMAALRAGKKTEIRRRAAALAW